MGFEPTLGYYPKHAFQACDFNRSSTSPSDAFYCIGVSLTRKRRGDNAVDLQRGFLSATPRDMIVRPNQRKKRA